MVSIDVPVRNLSGGRKLVCARDRPADSPPHFGMRRRRKERNSLI
jgi:hypothetical protein